MLQDRIEWKWIEAFRAVFELSEIQSGDPVAILSETQSRSINVHLAELALQQIGAKAFHVVMPTPPLDAPVAVRSTGSSPILQKIGPVVSALKEAAFVADLSVEGLMHAEETPEILGAGSRILYISNEHPEALERLKADPDLIGRVLAGRKLMAAGGELRVTSKAGTDLTVSLDGARVGGNLGVAREPGSMATWAGGICSCFPARDSVNGVLVLNEGDVNCTFKRYIEKPVILTIEQDFVSNLEGRGIDADLMREYFDAWGDREAYGASHLGWGMNHAARWDSLAMYDKADTNCIEQRAFAGNFLYSTGANPFADRYTLGHFDLPLRNCSIELNGEVLIDNGELKGALA
ncbi:MAG: peptidase M29 [Pseudomonadota bacterium]